MRITLYGVLALIALSPLFAAGNGEATETGEQQLSVLMFQHPSQVGYDEMPVEVAIQERLGVDVTYIKVQGSVEEQLNIVLASGDLPDVGGFVNEAQVNSWVTQGALLPMDELLAERGPNIMAVLTDEDLANLRNPVDGRLYHVSAIRELIQAQSFGVRTDWLQDLGLEPPNTLAEWETMLTVFRDEDPSGTGRTVPYVAQDFRIVGWAYGIHRSGSWNNWYIDEAGNYGMAFDHPNFGDYLETARRWYAEGFMDTEYFARNTSGRRELLTSGLAGASFDWGARFGQFTDAIRGVDGDGTFAPILPPMGPNGDRMMLGRDKYGMRAAITVQAEERGRVEIAMRYLDFLFSPEGTELSNFGIEGVHHQLIDGRPVLVHPYNDGWDAKRAEGLNYQLSSVGVWLVEAYRQSLTQGRDSADLDEQSRLVYDALFINTPYLVRPMRPIDGPALREHQADLFPLLSEQETRAIIGEISIEEFFETVEEVRDAGLEQIIRETRETWARLR